MPNSDEQQVALAERKLGLLLNLAEEVLALQQAPLMRLNHALRENTIPMTWRNRVLIGLALKAFASFERLLVDARERRAECSHHLKTMVESFIYSHWVSRETGEQRARLVYAEGCRARAIYHESLQETQYANEWRELLTNIIRGIEAQWESFRKTKLERLAQQCGLSEHYRRIYRMACEAAHIADLSVYMPPDPGGDLSFSPAPLSLLRAYVSLGYGIHLACGLLHDASDVLRMEADQTIQAFRDRLTSIQAMSE
jgi:hypothetical protein